MFPVFASFGLFGLFLAFMWFPREYINMVLTVYFLAFGIGALAATMNPIFNRIMGKSDADNKNFKIKNPFSTSELRCNTQFYKSFI